MAVPGRNTSTRTRRGPSGVMSEPRTPGEAGSEWEVRLRGRSCGGDGWRACGEAQTGQEGPDHLGVGDHGNDRALSRASGTLQNVKLEDPADQVRPAQNPLSQGHQALAEHRGARRCGWRGRRAVRAISNDGGPPFGARCQNSVVTEAVPTRRRDEDGKLFYEFELGEDDVGGSVSPGVSELVGNAAVGKPAEPLSGNGAPQNVSAQPFQML